jgi:hypothetical protein
MKFRSFVRVASLVMAFRRMGRTRTVVMRGSDELARKMVRSVKRLS